MGGLVAAGGLLALAVLTGALALRASVLAALVLLALMGMVVAWFTYPSSDDSHYVH